MELVILGCWIALWVQPRWSALDKAGVVYFLTTAPGALLIYVLAPDWFRVTLTWYTWYVAALFLAGVGIVHWRIRGDRQLAAAVRERASAWAPVISSAVGANFRRVLVVLVIPAIWVFLTALFAPAGSLLWALLTALTVLVAPFLLPLYLWGAAAVADWVLGSEESSPDSAP